jgi:hypothetical protein
MRLRRLLVLVCALALPVVPAASARPAPHLTNPTSTGRTLVIRFFVLIQHKDAGGLDRLLSPAFQVQRADGSSSGKAEYLKHLASIERFYLSNLVATEAGGTLVVRYLARVVGQVNGKPYTPGPAPRLTVFGWTGERWQLVAHANFNPLTG